MAGDLVGCLAEPMRDDKILVTGATGKTGRRVVRLLEDRSVEVRAASRSGTPSFDWSDRTTWAPALRGMTAVYLVLPDLGSSSATETVTAFARQAAAAGVRRAVLVSVPDGGGLDHEPVLATERALADVGLEWTALRLRWFFQNFSEDFLLGSVLNGELRLPAGTGEEGFIDADDIAEVAVAALTEDGHDGQAYELSGPRLMTFGDTAEDLAKATGRDIRYVPLTPEEFAAEQRAQGVPEEWVQLQIAMYGAVGSGSLASLTGDVQRVLGRAPRDFSDYAKEAAAQGAWQV